MSNTSYQNVYVPRVVAWPRSELLQLMTDVGAYRPTFIHVNEKSFSREIAARRATGAAAVNTHSHQFYHIFLYTQGQNEVTLQGKRHAVKAGTILCISPGEKHSISPHIARAYSRLELNLKYINSAGESFVEPVNRLLGRMAGLKLDAVPFPATLSATAATEAEQLMRDILRVLPERCQETAMRARLLLGRLYGAILEDMYLTEHSPPEATGLSHVRVHIEDHLAEPLSISELATTACISRAHFIRRFRETYGLPPIAYQRKLRIDKAKQLLLYSDLTATEIAEQLGFRTVQYFNRVFTKLADTPPIRFRRENQ